MVKKRVVLSVILVLILVTVSLVIAGVVYANGDTSAPGASLNVGGVSYPVEVGTRINVASSEDGESCVLPEVSLEGGLTEDLNAGHITALIDADCSISILSMTSYHSTDSGSGDSADGAIESEEPAPETVPSSDSLSGSYNAASTSTYRGWAKSELHDFIHLSLTSVYAEMFYDDNGFLVFNGRWPTNRCNTLYGGWYIISCSSYWQPHGFSKVLIRTTGTFRHHVIQPSRHQQTAEFYAVPGRGNYKCTHSGQVWGPVHWNCKGLRFSH